MFIVNITYKSSLEEIDKHLESHVEFLKEQYSKENFIVSGRKIPRTGGIILSKLEDKETLEKILDTDPFKVNDLAEYEIIEFVPSMVGSNFENLL